ncbi:Y-family DNA polymerase [Bacteroidales bacterium OttesenSCG-928-A17]|nr:Y-family DNA polymerase [Bacteroidales bacterium OttesenSCG-928-A17]
MYALCDGNNFFVSCERVFDSSLDGKPVIVLSNNDGCAIARSNEAKALGIKMGANYFEIEALVKKHNVQVFSTNFVLYADMSMRMKGLLSRFCPEVEDYSIDEAFLDFTGFDKINLRNHCLEMARTVKQGIGIPVSVGVASTKTLAKIANKFAKKYTGYKSVCIIDTEEKRVKALQKTEVGDVWGIGRRHTKRLLDMGVQTAYDFTLLNQSWVRKHMTIVGERTWRELHGEPCIKMETIQPDKQSIMVSRSFGKMIEDFSTIQEAATNYACMAAAKLRKQKSCAKSLLVFLDTNPFREDLPQYSQHIIINLPVATNSSMEIVGYVTEGLSKIFRPGFKYKKAGVMLMDICSQDAVQGSIWDTIDREKHKRLMEVLDRTNDKYGRNTLKLAVLGDGEQWKIKQERLSPCYTTRIGDFPKTK